MTVQAAPATLTRVSDSQQKSDGFWAAAYKRLRKNRIASISAIFILFLAATALIGPAIYPHDYAVQDRSMITQGPSWSHPMGTDQLGRDILARMIFGARISLTVGIVVQTVILLIGVPAGLCAGFFGGKIDMAIMRIVDVLYALPSLLFVIVIMTFLRGTLSGDLDGIWGVIGDFDKRTGGLIGVYIGLGMIGWLTVSRIVRANTMSLKRREFAEAAVSMGAGRGRIMFRHLLPNTVAPIVVAATLGIPAAILSEAGISFLGLGVIPPMPSWGLMISEAIPHMRSNPYMLIFPAACLSTTVLAFNFLGDGLRDALDPWMKR
jgi:oligopeptide transport system permease protein